MRAIDGGIAEHIFVSSAARHVVACWRRDGEACALDRRPARWWPRMFSGAIPAQGSRSRELAVMPAVQETARRLRMVFGCAGRALAVTADPGRAGGRGRPCSRWRSRPTARASVSADGRSSGRRVGHGELLRAARATEHPLDPRRWRGRWTWRRNRSRKRGQFAPIAQLDRASVFGTECRGFESLWACNDSS